MRLRTRTHDETHAEVKAACEGLRRMWRWRRALTWGPLTGNLAWFAWCWFGPGLMWRDALVFTGAQVAMFVGQRWAAARTEWFDERADHCIERGILIGAIGERGVDHMLLRCDLIEHGLSSSSTETPSAPVPAPRDVQ